MYVDVFIIHVVTLGVHQNWSLTNMPVIRTFIPSALLPRGSKMTELIKDRKKGDHCWVRSTGPAFQ